MLSSVRNTLRIPDLRGKILFTLLMIALYRAGAVRARLRASTSTPCRSCAGRPSRAAASSASSSCSPAVRSPSSPSSRSGIMPYITSSIIMQILTVVIPKLEEWQQMGAVGQRKITQWTRYLAVSIALLQSTGLAFLFHNGGGGLLGGQGNATGLDILPNFTPFRVIIVVLTLTAGTALLMWMGELISQRGIGNGMSLLIFASVVSSFPGAGARLNAEKGGVLLTLLLILAVVLLVGIVFIEQGQRRVPVQFAKRVVGRRMYGGQSTYIPLKVNQSGVIPIIFASSVLYLPILLTNVLPADGWGAAVQRWVNGNLVQPDSIYYVVVYGLLIVGFAYFYTAIAFDPATQAENIRKQGGFIPGIRPGPQTERYLAKILARITLPGALLHRLDRAAAVAAARGRRRAELPVRRHLDPHRCGRGPRDDEADRQPADDAQLRGLPQVRNLGVRA